MRHDIDFFKPKALLHDGKMRCLNQLELGGMETLKVEMRLFYIDFRLFTV